jgi:hypothetical protein
MTSLNEWGSNDGRPDPVPPWLNGTLRRLPLAEEYLGRRVTPLDSVLLVQPSKESPPYQRGAEDCLE